MIDLTFSTQKAPSKGDILLSDPFESDQYFTRSVVLLCDHDDNGSFGFVLNNYLDIKLHSLIPKFPSVDTKVSVGGPVDTESVFYIHTFGEFITGSTKIGEALYFGGDFDEILEQMNQTPENVQKVRFFLGYSGWSPNQLKEEMSKNSWIVSTDYKGKDLFDTHEKNLWEKLMKKQGKKFEMMANFPLDPTNN